MPHSFTKFSFFLFLFAFFGGIISFLPLNANALTCNSDCYENYNDPQNDCTCISSWGEICGADGDCWICNSSETCASGGNFCSLSSECKRYYYYYTCYDVSQGGGCKSNSYYLTDNSCTGLCDSGKCSGGSCVPACTSHYTYSCYNKDVYWYDSCGNREGKKEECNDGSGWYNEYRCDGNQPQRRYWVRGCSGSSCYTNTNNWSDWGSACPGDYCDYPPGDPYCYNDNVYQDYSCHDAGCSGGSCYDNPYTDKQLIENCNAGSYWTNDYQCSADGRYLQRKYYINDCHNNDCRTRYYWDEDYQDCGTNSWTNEYRCSDSMRQRKAHYKGCSGADCYDYYGWQDYDDCSDCSCSCGGYNATESTANGNCSDGKDNDCDGKTDSADSGCATCSDNCPSDCSGYDTHRCDTDSTECTYNPYYKSGSYCYYNCSQKKQYGSEWCYCYDKDYCPGAYDECTANGCKNCAPPTGTIDASKTTVIVGEEFTITITGRDDNDVYYITYNEGSNSWDDNNKQKCSFTQTECTKSWDITKNTAGTYTYYGWVQDSDNSGGHGCSSDHKAGIGSVIVTVTPKGCSEECPPKCSGYDSWKCDTSSTRCTSYPYYSSGSYCYYGCSRQSQYGSEWCYCYNKEECNWDYQRCSSSGCACDASCQSPGAVGGYIAPFHCVYCGSVCGWTNYRPMELPPWGSASVCLLGTDCYIQAFYEDERREDCSGSATICQLSKCPSIYSSAYNGDSCTVRRSNCGGMFYEEFGLVSRGVWDAYESKCIECDYTTHKESAVCGDTTANYQECDCGFSLSCDYYKQKEDFPCNGSGDNQCEWACGASQACDEKTPGDSCGAGKICSDSCICKTVKPDLIITDAWDYNDTIKYTIKNQGGDADYSYTALYIDGTYTEYDYVAALSAGSSANGSFSYDWKTNCTDETDLIQVCADYYGARVDESDETNNCRSETWDCPQLDLIITEVKFGESDKKVHYTIKNQGETSAGSSKSSLYVDGSYQTYDDVSSLSAGYSSNEVFSGWTCTPGQTYSIKVCADKDNEVAEENEGNNCKTESLACPGKPDLIITDIWPESSTIKYTIKNQGELDADYSYTNLYIDGSYQEYNYVDALSVGSSKTSSFSYNWLENCTPPSDIIKVCADDYDYIDESDEDNNCKEETRDCGCIIGGETYEDGECNPSNKCQYCDISEDPEHWSSVPSAEICANSNLVLVSSSYYCYYDEDCDDGDCEATQWWTSCNGTGDCRPASDHADPYQEDVTALNGKVLRSNCSQTSPSPSYYCGIDNVCSNGNCSGHKYYRACNGSGSCRTDDTYAYDEIIYASASYSLTSSCEENGLTLCDSTWRDSSGSGDNHYGKGGDYSCQGMCDGSGKCEYAVNCNLVDNTSPTTEIKIIRTSTGEDVTAAGIWLKANNYTIKFEDKDEPGGSGLKYCEYSIYACDSGGTNCTTAVVPFTTRNCNWSFQITAGTSPYHLEGVGRYRIYSGATDNTDNSGTDYKYLNFDFTPPETRIE